MRNGFTLIELLIVMAVIGGLTGIVMMQFRSGREEALDTQRRSDLKQFQAALEVYASKNNHKFPPNSGSMQDVCPYLQLLNCPENSAGDYHYVVDSSGYNYYIWAELADKTDFDQEQFYVICSSGQVVDTVVQPSGASCPISDITPTPIPPPGGSTPTPSLPGGGTNLITNGSFEEDDNSWSWYDNGNTTFNVINGGTDGTNMARIDKRDSTGTNIQLNQHPVDLEPNTNYRITFDAKADSITHMELFVHKHSGPPYPNYGLNAHRVNIGTSWQTFTVNFTSTPNAGSGARFRFWFRSTPPSMIDIDDVVFEEI